jgi:hypothetical protein
VKTPALVAAAVILSLMVAGCSPNSQAVTVGNATKSTASVAPVEQGARAQLSTKQVTASLPTAAQLGATWVDGKSSSDSSDDSDTSKPTIAPESCSFLYAGGELSQVAIVPKADKPIAKATADFHVKPASGDTLGLETDGASISIESYKDNVDPSKLASVASALKKCTKFTSTDSSSGLTAQFQIFPESLPNYADGTLAFRIQGTVSIVVVLVDLVVIVSGHNLITITQTGIGGIDTKMGANAAKSVMANLTTRTK